jgi:hypothetical protein
MYSFKELSTPYTFVSTQKSLRIRKFTLHTTHVEGFIYEFGDFVEIVSAEA